MKENKEKTIKKPKQKLTVFDIVYKVITAVMAAAMFPICYFSSLVYVEIAHPSALNTIVNLFSGCDTQQISSTTYEKLSIKRLLELLDFIKSFSTDKESFNIWSLEHFRPAIIAAGFLAFALLIGFIIFVVIIFIKNEKVIMGLSATGFVSTLIATIIFNQGFAAPILSGEVSISELLNIGGFITETILTFIGNIINLNLDIGFYLIMFLMLGIFFWSLSIFVVNLEDNAKKKQNKLAKK